MAFTQATQQALWLTKFFNEVGLPTATPVVIHADNNGSISNSTNDKNYRQTKCVDIKQRIKLGQCRRPFHKTTTTRCYAKICQGTKTAQMPE